MPRYLAYLVVVVVLGLPDVVDRPRRAVSARDEFAYPPGFCPHPTLFGNFSTAAEGSHGVGSVWPFFRNSLMYAVAATAGCLIMQSIVGYGFARFEFPGRKLLFGMTIAMMMMPVRCNPHPAFILSRDLHLANTLWPLVIPWWFGGSPYGIFLMRQFFMSIPRAR